ncbi:hypothetical protein F2Q69_00052085 [Brassica cretica]|uniref:RNA-dependent RNA polymerase n=1 Tax=Brassica cretica TaxID=69181 RepID=A0A8S9MQ21_BRACR|nr:hypothetical protein F2Q69_00052085 [Brassica cretica]
MITWQRSVIVLSSRLESVLEKIYGKHKCPPINEESRQRLSSIPEDLAFDLLRKAFNSPGISNLDRFIASKLTHAVTVTSSPTKSASCSSQEEISIHSEAPSLTRQQVNGGSSLHIPPPQLLLALSELEFNKAFLLLTYIPGKDLSQVKITADEIRGWKDLSMVAYEAAVWDSLGHKFCSPTDRRLSLEWDNEKTSYYQCHVASDGSYTFKGPLLEPTGTHLHKVLGDANVLTVKFEDLPPRTVQVRPSMVKVSKDPALSDFSTFDSLEVVTTSNPPKRTKLSKNLVALLSYGGIPDEFFLDILLNTLEEYKTIFNNKHAALKAALNYGDMDDQNAAQMILVGIPLDEPHLKDHLSILSNTEKNDLRAGKLPVSESYYLMGTVDPTGELKEDEVCVILESGQISGNVLVYRNPGLHFGDIHVLKATYVKALEEYVGNSKYGVFFPQKGPRSLGDEIAGGDFDGDLYFISRNPELLEHFKPSEPWVSLTPPTKGNSARKPSHLSPAELEEELFDMFLKARFNASNVVGMAADSWLTIMDRFLVLGDENAEEKAEMKKKMLKLIDIYYDALDAPKKGAKVFLPDELRPDIFPHYMERDQKFKSTSILGMIYDFVKSQTAEEHKPSAEISKLACFEDEPVSDYHKKKWGQLYEKYRKEMIQAMGNKDESANEVIQRYKQEFYDAAGFEDNKKSIEELYPQALALYNVVYDHAIIMDNVRNCGFAWKVAGPILCRFYLEKKQGKSLLCSLPMLKELWG